MSARDAFREIFAVFYSVLHEQLLCMIVRCHFILLVLQNCLLKISSCSGHSFTSPSVTEFLGNSANSVDASTFDERWFQVS